MKCSICGKEADSVSVHFEYGISCSEKCSKVITDKRSAIHAELLAEPLNACPEAFETADFERWALKVALHVLRGLDKPTESKLRENNPMMLVPEQFALELKDRILNQLNPVFVSSVEARGHERIFHGGTYCLRQPVPLKTMIDAAKKAQVLQ